MRWRATRDEQVSQSRQNTLVLDLPRNDERQTFPAGLVDDRRAGNVRRAVSFLIAFASGSKSLRSHVMPLIRKRGLAAWAASHRHL